jgi:DNA (cytosine-5)-methyltransferase 1
MLRTVELFAGIGGVTGGFLDAGGFAPALLIDSDRHAATAFRTNFPMLAAHYHTRSISANLRAATLRAMADGEIDGILGCPPCQGFSPAGLRDQWDFRNALLFQMGRLINGLRPRFFVMENVPSLLTSSEYRLFEERVGQTYAIHAEVLNAAEYGVPQLRRRATVIGFHRDLGITPTAPPPTHGGAGRVFDYSLGRYVHTARPDGRYALQLRPRVQLPPVPLVTLRAALADLPEQPPHMRRARHPEPATMTAMTYATSPRTDFQRRIRGGATEVLNHRCWQHTPGMVTRMRRVSPGDCPRNSGSRSRNMLYFSQAYARLHHDGLARTITTNFHNPGSGRFTHFASPRTLTLREALRLQGFPDSFHFDGLHASDAERLIGNAFPRLLAEAIGRHIEAALGGRV